MRHNSSNPVTEEIHRNRDDNDDNGNSRYHHNYHLVHYGYAYAPEQEKLFFVEIYLGSKFFPSLSEIIGVHVADRCVRDFSLFNVCLCSKKFPSGRCASADNIGCRSVDIFGTKIVSLDHIL